MKKKLIIWKTLLFLVSIFIVNSNTMNKANHEMLINKNNKKIDTEIWKQIDLFFQRVHRFEITKIDDLFWKNIEFQVKKNLESINANIKVEAVNKNKREICGKNNKYFCIAVIVSYNNEKVNYDLFIDYWIFKKEEIKEFIRNFYDTWYNWNLSVLNNGWDVLNILRKKMSEISNDIAVDLRYNSFNEKLKPNSDSFRIKIIYDNEIIYQTLKLKKILSHHFLINKINYLLDKNHNFDLSIVNTNLSLINKLQQQVNEFMPNNNIEIGLNEDETLRNLLPNKNIINFWCKVHNIKFFKRYIIKNIKFNEQNFWKEINLFLKNNRNWNIIADKHDIATLLLVINEKIKQFHSELSVELKENDTYLKKHLINKVDNLSAIFKLGEKEKELNIDLNFRNLDEVEKQFNIFFEATHLMNFNIFNTWQKIFDQYLKPKLNLIYTDISLMIKSDELKKEPDPGYSELPVSVTFSEFVITKSIKIKSVILDNLNIIIEEEIQKMNTWIVSTENTYEHVIEKLNNNLKKLRIDVKAELFNTNYYLSKIFTDKKYISKKDNITKNKLAFKIKISDIIYLVQLKGVQTKSEILSDFRNYFLTEQDLFISTISSIDKIKQNLLKKVSEIFIFTLLKSVSQIDSKHYQITINIFNTEFKYDLTLKDIFDFDPIKNKLNDANFIYNLNNEQVNNFEEWMNAIESQLRNIFKNNDILIEFDYVKNMIFEEDSPLELGVKIFWKGDVLEKKIIIPEVVLINELKAKVNSFFNKYYDFYLSVENTYDDALLKINEELKKINTKLSAQFKLDTKNSNLKFRFDKFMINIYYKNININSQLNVKLKNVRFNHENDVKEIDKIVEKFKISNVESTLVDFKKDLQEKLKKTVNRQIEVEILNDYVSQEIKILVYLNADLIIYKF